MSMARSTRSKAAAAATPQQPTQDDPITLNWAFFNKSNPHNRPLSIHIPRLLFKGPVGYCQDIFSVALKKYCKFKADETTIQFWDPKELLLVATVGKRGPGWTEGIDDQKFNDSFEEIYFPLPLADVLKGLDNKTAIHLVITASYESAIPDEKHGEDRDMITELPEVRRHWGYFTTPGRSPSHEAKSKQYASVQIAPFETIYDGRYSPGHPFSTVAPPIQIFHSIFDTFARLVPSVQPNNEDLINVQDLMHTLSVIDPLETERNPKIHEGLSKILGVDIVQQPNDDGTCANGAYMLSVDGVRIAPYLDEFKRDIGDGGSDPSQQVGIRMRKSWIQKDRQEISNKCCCPTLMIAGAGAWMCVLGGVFPDKPIVQRLTDMMWVGHSSTEEDPRVYRFARVLVALRKCIQELSNYYLKLGEVESFKFEPKTTHPRLYPYPTSFKEGKEIISFAYTKMLEDDSACVTYQAKIIGEADSPDIVVKFVTRYGEEVHKFLAGHGHVPKLRYCGPLDINLPADKSKSLPSDAPSGLSLGPMQMIVMDYIPTCEKPPLDAHEQIQVVLCLLHPNGYVLGDLRRQNVLFNKQGKVKIIDLDWSGRYDRTNRDGPPVVGDTPDKKGHSYVCYPLNLSKSIKWAPGVKDLAPIRPEHDVFMLSAMNLRA
ncbi:hypothetical protein BD779DRAFT_1652902 [Infundibulicybe gibba]|nr:hypothetical protein BD779DRAFT_1652902 [Infundibulicybe gibba]